MLDKIEAVKRERYVKYLKDKKEVSTPMIQRDMNLKYLPAREIIFDMQGMSLISQNFAGISYKVNTGLASPKVLDSDELVDAAEYLDETRLSLLEKILRRETVWQSDNLEPIDETEDGYGDLIDEMIEKGYVHRFDSRLFVSVSRDSIEVIKTGKRVLDRDKTIAHIGYPILKYCIDHEEEPDQRLLECSFMPENCRKYIERGYRMYKENGRIPKNIVVPRLDPEDRSLKTEILTAFLAQYTANTLFLYTNESRRALRTVSMSRACSESYQEACATVSKEICSMSLEKIKELKQIAQSYCQPDGEDDELDRITSILLGKSDDYDDDDDDDFDF